MWVNGNRWKKVLAAGVGLWLSASAMALASPAMQDVRYHSGTEHDRIVFDLSETPLYDVKPSADGRTVTIDFQGVSDRHFRQVPIQTSRVSSVTYAEKAGHLLVTLHLKSGLSYKVSNLHSPARVFIDILPASEAVSDDAQAKKSVPQAVAGSGAVQKDPKNTYEEEMAPGLTKKTYVYWDDDGKVTAYFVEADHNRYTVKPALGRGKIPGVETVSGISDRYQALAAINASYFNWNGELIGDTKIDGQVVGTTYYTRSAFGILPDGSPVFGKVSYDGSVTIDGITQPVGGVDAERAEDSVTLYNRCYGATTQTNEYGMEYVGEGGVVTAIHQQNSPIPKDGWVVSAHGKAKDAFANVKVGDRVTITQELGSPWNQAVQMVGAGPRLLEHGAVHVTAAEEEFPGDIRYGRAPRSAIAVMANGDYLLGVVDGRQASSHGLTLTEWAYLLKKFGAVDAINFDGGGSSELVVGGQVVNSPSDGNERSVGAALLVLPKTK